VLTLERLKSATEQAEQHLRAWGLSGVSVECEDDEDVLAIKVVDEAKSFAETFAIVRHDGWMTISLNPRNHMVIKVDDWGDQDLSLMFAFSALSNLLSSKTGWLPSTDTTLILSWGYDHKENAWEVEVLAIKDVPYTDPPSEVTLTLNASLLKGGQVALSGLLCGKEWDITFKRTGSFHSLMRALVGLVLAFAACNDHNLKVVNSSDRQGCI
jgi:hypothetical protein